MRFSHVGLKAIVPALSIIYLSAARAESSGDPVLDLMIKEALESRPEVAKDAATVKAEKEHVPLIGALPDPVLSLGLQNDGFNHYSVGKMETSWYTIMATQTFLWPGKQRLLKESARAQADLADAALQRTRLSVEAEVRRSYVDLQLVRDRAKLLSKQRSLWQKSEKIAAARYAVGEAPQSDLLRAQLEMIRLRQQALSLEATERTSTQSLNRLRHHPLGESVSEVPSLEHLPDPQLPSADITLDPIESRSPELRASKLSLGQAGSRLQLAQAERFPDFSIGAGVMPRGRLEPMWLVSLGIPLPVFAATKQDKAVSEAVLRRTAVEQGELAVAQLLRLRTEQRRSLLDVLHRTNVLYRDALLVQSEATATSTLAQYEVGKVPFASVLDALGGFLSDQASYLESIAQAQRVFIAQIELSLEEPTRAPGPPPSSSGM